MYVLNNFSLLIFQDTKQNTGAVINNLSFFLSVRAGESLMKLVSDIKQYLILNDFPSVNEAIAQNSKLFRTKQQECDQKLMSLRDDIAADLYDLEDEYFTSIYK